jgi:hypothetical protein
MLKVALLNPKTGCVYRPAFCTTAARRLCMYIVHLRYCQFNYNHYFVMWIFYPRRQFIICNKLIAVTPSGNKYSINASKN